MTKNVVQTLLQFLIGLEVVVLRELIEIVQVVVDLLQCVIIIEKSTGAIELGLVVVPVTFNLTNLQFEVCTASEVEGVDRLLHLQTEVALLFGNLIKDLLTELVKEHLTLIVRIGRICDNVNVGVVRQLTFLFAGNIFIRITTTIPQSAVVLRNRIFLSQP